MAYFIGVDGGGTKTYYALFNEHKRMLADCKTSGSNHENLEGGFDEAVDILWEGLTALTAKAGITLADVQFTLMGLAGVDHPFQHDALAERLQQKGLQNFELFNDGYIVVKAGSISGAAIGLNNGTGTCCNAIDSDGTMLMLAGLDVFTGDMGNGHWIATECYRAIYDDVYLGIRQTVLTQLYYKQFDLHTREEFLGAVSAFETEDAEDHIRALIDCFFIGVDEKDEACLEILDRMSTRSAQLIVAHANQLHFDGDEIEVVLSGSILTKLPSEKYLAAIKQKVAERSGRKFRFIKLAQPPVVGCVNWILQEYAD